MQRIVHMPCIVALQSRLQASKIPFARIAHAPRRAADFGMVKTGRGLFARRHRAPMVLRPSQSFAFRPCLVPIPIPVRERADRPDDSR